MDQTLTAIVPAAGIGARAAATGGVPKQYREIAGEAVLRRTVQALLSEPRIGQVRVAVSPQDVWVDQVLGDLPRTVWRACGGPTRADTVRAALRDAALPTGSWVMVHDAARPGLPAEALARLIDACWAHECGGLLAMPVSDTVKFATRNPGTDPASGAAMTGADVGGSATVAKTVDRDLLWLAQTPQMFRAGELLDALTASAGDARVTDEASAMELAGQSPLLVRGAHSNMKLTWPEDFEWLDGWFAGAGFAGGIHEGDKK